MSRDRVNPEKPVSVQEFSTARTVNCCQQGLALIELFRAICVFGKLSNNRLSGKVNAELPESRIFGKFNHRTW
jgi:hypothetical protein